jgi:hypothetical protein
MSSLERARPLAHEGRFARPVRGKREWDENENETESWQVERTARRRIPSQARTPLSPEHHLGDFGIL